MVERIGPFPAWIWHQSHATIHPYCGEYKGTIGPFAEGGTVRLGPTVERGPTRIFETPVSKGFSTPYPCHTVVLFPPNVPVAETQWQSGASSGHHDAGGSERRDTVPTCALTSSPLISTRSARGGGRGRAATVRSVGEPPDRAARHREHHHSTRNNNNPLRQTVTHGRRGRLSDGDGSTEGIVIFVNNRRVLVRHHFGRRLHRCRCCLYRCVRLSFRFFGRFYGMMNNETATTKIANPTNLETSKHTSLKKRINIPLYVIKKYDQHLNSLFYIL